MSSGKDLLRTTIGPAHCIVAQHPASLGGRTKAAPARRKAAGGAFRVTGLWEPAISGKGPSVKLRMETRLAEGGGRAPGSPKGGAGAGQTHGPEVACPPVPPVPARRRPRHAGYLSVGPMQAVSVLSISRRMRSCSAAVSRLSASAILLRSIDSGSPALSPPSAPLTFHSHSHPGLQSLPKPLAIRRTTPPSVTARPLASPRPPTFHAMPSGICSSLDDVRAPLIYSLKP